jgi:DGQHR domain-containing protein
MAESITYPCIIHSQRSDGQAPQYCVFAAKVGDILKWADIKRLTDQPGAPQRAVNKSKVLAVRRFLELDPRNSIPSGVIVNLNLSPKAFKPVGKTAPGELQLVTITFNKDKKPGFIVDGQHRLLGMNELDPNLQVTVIALLQANDMEIAFQFLVINNKASKVSTDHIRALALDYKKEDLDERLRKIRLNLDPRYEFVGFADNDEASPFRGYIDWPSNRTERKVVKPAAIEAAVADIQRRKVREFNDEDTVVTYFFTIWDTVRKKWPQPWEKETESRLLSKVGIVCMSAYLTDALVSAYDWGDLDISDPDAVRKRVNQLLAFQEEQFWEVGWTTTSLDTRAGREMVLEALSLVARNKRAELPWYEEIKLIDVNQLENFEGDKTPPK